MIFDLIEELLPEIRAARDSIDREGRLPLPLVGRLRRAQLFGLWLPAALGGPELHPIEFARAIERLASADGSVGWCAGVAGTLSVLGASLPAEVAREVFGAHGALAGAFRPKGRAVAAPGGYRVTGRWEFGSGILHADWVAVHCVAEAPELRFVVVPRSEVEVIPNWDVTGLRGTGSHDFRIDDVFVPAERSLAAFAAEPLLPGPLYRIPLLGLSTIALAAVTLGLARAAIDAFVELAAAKTPTGASLPLRDDPRAQFAAGRAEALLRAARSALFDALREAWDHAVSGDAPSAVARVAMRMACAFCAEACARAVDIVYAAAGASAIFEGGVIARCFRDVHAATAHIGLSADNYQHAGKVLFGGDDPAARFG